MRIEQQYKDMAKAEGLALFQVMIDLRKIPVEQGGGYMYESSGCMSLSQANRILEIIREND